MGAVTTERTPVPGCRVQPLGVMRYIPVASQGYIKRHLPDGFTAQAVAAAPSLAWNRDDALQDMLVRKAFRRDIAGRSTSSRRRRASGRPCAPGLGWGMFPDSSRHRTCATARSCGSPMCTSTCRCTGSAGSSTARWSRPSPTPLGRPPKACVGAVSSWPAMSYGLPRGPNIIVRRLPRRNAIWTRGGPRGVAQLLRVQNFNVSRDGFGAGEDQSLERPFGHADPGDLFAWAGATASWPNRTDPGGSRGLDDYFTRDFATQHRRRDHGPQQVRPPARARGATTNGRAGGATSRRSTPRCSS